MVTTKLMSNSALQQVTAKALNLSPITIVFARELKILNPKRLLGFMEKYN